MQIHVRRPPPLEHGAPLRLRVETQLGYKMVKYVRSIELVADYRTIGEGQGGSREDTQFFGRDAEVRAGRRPSQSAADHLSRRSRPEKLIVKGQLRRET